MGARPHRGLVSVRVDDHDAAMRFYVNAQGFELREDTHPPEQRKRWVVVAPPGAHETGLLLARATTEAQRACGGHQAGDQPAGLASGG
jgi:catechol 2,3-dioxygenase-like lactoylglutathione lyase family enzyme